MDCNALDILSDLQSGHSGYQLIDGAVRCLTNLETHLHCTFNDLKIRRDVLGKSKKKKYGLYTRGRFPNLKESEMVQFFQKSRGKI